MTTFDLLGYLLEHYFDQWEIDRAHKIWTAQGKAAAIEYLRKEAVHSWRGCSGPDIPRHETRFGNVLAWTAGTDKFGREPDLIIPCQKLASIKLSGSRQLKLL